MPDVLSEKDKENLLKLYHEFNSNRIDYNTRKWETVKFFTSLNAVFITATVGIATFIYKNGGAALYTKFILSILPISVFFVSYLGWLNLKRESRLLFEQEASMFKIEKYLGFHNEIKEEDKKWLPGDPYLVPPKHHNIFHGAENLKNINPECITIEMWVKAKLQEHGFLKTIMTSVFVVEIGAAVALLFLIFLSL